MNTIVLVAHPDDETLGAGGLLLRLAPDVHVMHLTDGAPHDHWFAAEAGCATREDYAALRQRELDSALAIAGIDEVTQLGAVDQEAARDLVRLSRRFALLVARLQPRLVVTHAYEGGHPDHDAAAFVAAYARHRTGCTVWELPLYHEHGRQCFLPRAGTPQIDVPLDPTARAVKRQMLDCFASQAAVFAEFAVDRERFRPAPSYDFTQPPHPGRLYYERWRWPLDGEGWRALAARALEQLGLSTGTYAPYPP